MNEMNRDADDGDEFRASPTKDEELQKRFAEVSKLVGKLPRTLRSVVKGELGTDEVEIVEEKLMGLKTDREAFVSLKRSAADAADRADKAETERLIEEGLDKRLITPADAKKMRGVDPATGAVSGKPWNKARVERFVGERAEVGPVADVVRPGEQRTVRQDQSTTSTVVAAASKVQIRTAKGGPAASEQSLTQLAQTIGPRLGLDAGTLLGQVDAARALPSSEGHEAIKRAQGLK
jgi:hypothetical protein